MLRTCRAGLALGALALAASAAPAPEVTPLVRLADRLAEALVRSAPGRPLELAPIEARGALATAGLDLLALTRARLEGRRALATSGPRLRVVALLTQSADRLLLSARLLEEPGERLVDIVSVSVEAAPSLTTDARPTASKGPFDVLARVRSTPIDGPLLALALVGAERLLALTPDALTLLRWNGQELSQEARRPLPMTRPVRRPGGLLLVSKAEDDVWVATSGSPAAILFGLNGGRLVERSRAAALPWPGTQQGVRYRPGTNWVEAPLGSLGSSPLLALMPALPDWAVSTSAELMITSEGAPRSTGLLVGPGLALLDAGAAVALSAAAPSTQDRLLLITIGSDGPKAAGALPITFEGAARTLAARSTREGTRLVVGVETSSGETELEFLELRRRVEALP